MSFTSNKNKYIRHNPSNRVPGLIDSSLNTNQIFNGDYWDDCLLPMYFRQQTNTVLVLGVGLGSGFRSLYAANPSLDVVGVDIDQQAIDECNQLIERNFEHHPILIADDALNYLISSKNTFDMILVDLYDSDGPVTDTFTSSFWTYLKARLNPGGIVAANVYGIANHLERYLDESPLKSMAAAAKQSLKYIKVAPHRRNTTIIASGSPLNKVYPIDNNAADNIDRLTLKTQYLRSKHLVPFFDVAHQPVRHQFTFEQINHLQREAWGQFLAEFNGTLNDITFISPRALVETLSSPDTGPCLLQSILEKCEHLSVMLPTYLGAEIHNRDMKLDWYFEYLFEHAKDLSTDKPYLWFNFFLPQWISMLNSKPSWRTLNFSEKINKCGGLNEL
ncbi:MAG: hypothetical protein H6626_10785 [Pseudobdellovibrionaceae bacterium]|nr:hypothetical protein [Bdellovibrionales bacterium]USN46690.1 MAG: hypothetical protein H6626_10785 [Pseudobdellovibrionaceae bacterium]